ncbi:MAG: hypothetical protein IJC05_07420 [Phascolarctobacterium sp.]|nr:hypothetical protein [Phascolarctobacterium sp.]MBR2139285.1 hypothetical protein [Phascolarctobacterium sp.]
MAQFKDFNQYNSFWKMLVVTKKYRELYSEHCSIIALVLGLILFALLLAIYDTSGLKAFIDLAKNLLISFSVGLLGLLGVYITGLALMASMMTKDALYALEERNCVESLLSVLFCFYFAGACTLATLFAFIVSYLLIHIGCCANEVFIKGVTLFLCLSFMFSVSYTVALLGTCINMFFANIYLSNKSSSKNKQSDCYNVSICNVKEKLNLYIRKIG